MDSKVRTYVFGTLAFIIVSVVAFVAIKGFSQSFLSWFMPAMVLVVAYPCVVIGLYMWLDGRSGKYLNIGVDWAKIDGERIRDVVAYAGIWMTVSMVILCWSLTLILGNIILGILLSVVSIALAIVPAFKVNRLDAIPRAPAYSGGTKVALFIVISIVAVAPCTVIDDLVSEMVDVTFGEDTVSIHAPMVELEFGYGEIDEVVCFEDFDKGRRMMGFGTPTVMSGHFYNDMFGDYTLASYTKVRPAVAFSVDGEIYAFNLSDDGSTYAAYLELTSRVGMPTDDF